MWQFVPLMNKLGPNLENKSEIDRKCGFSAMFVRSYVFARKLPIKAHIKTLMFYTNIFGKKIKIVTVCTINE